MPFIEVLSEYKCPITYEIMDDPVFTADGNTYERSSIERWLKTHNTSPSTNIPLLHKNLTPNIALKQLISRLPTMKSFIRDIVAGIDIAKLTYLEGYTTTTPEQGSNPLHAAVCNNRLLIASYLLEHGADVNAKENFGPRGPALHWVKTTAMAKILLAHKADIHAIDDNGLCAMHVLPDLSGVDVEVIQLLIDAGASPSIKATDGTTPLNIAARRRLDIVRLLVTKYKVDLNTAHVDRGTPLAESCIHGSLDIFRYLVDAGARLDIIDADGSTLLHTTVSVAGDDEARASMIDVLVGAGLNVNQLYGRNPPLAYACSSGLVECVRRLVRYGANIHHKLPHTGCTLLRFSIQFKHVAVASLLIKLGVDIHHNTSHGTALIRAVEMDLPTIVLQLIAAGVCLSATGYNGYTALHSACITNNGMPNMVQILVDAGADINAVDLVLDTPLHFACDSNSRECVRILVMAGVRTHMKNKDGKTVFDYGKCIGVIEETKKAILKAQLKRQQPDTEVEIIPTKRRKPN